jgi:hypothetical protein
MWQPWLFIPNIFSSRRSTHIDKFEIYPSGSHNSFIHSSNFFSSDVNEEYAFGTDTLPVPAPCTKSSDLWQYTSRSLRAFKLSFVFLHIHYGIENVVKYILLVVHDIYIVRHQQCGLIRKVPGDATFCPVVTHPSIVASPKFTP